MLSKNSAGSTTVSPHLYVLSTFSIVCAFIYLFHKFGYHDKFFFLPIFGVGLLWTAFTLARQRQVASYYFSIDRHTSLPRLLQKSIVRFIVWWLVLWLGMWVYSTHVLYVGNEKNLLYFQYFLAIYTVAGLPYFILTLKFRASRIEDFYDPALRMVHVAKQLIFFCLGKRSRVQIRRLFRHKYNRKVFLNLAMRGYFIPVMVVQVFQGFYDAIGMLQSQVPAQGLLPLLFWLTSILWLADALSASAAYALESRWLDNRSRSTDTTLSGWIICLICYAPMNQLTSALFPFGPTAGTGGLNTLILPSEVLLYTLEIIELLVLAALVYSDLSLGPSGANITFKKLQNRGPYGVVRHPATTCKLTLWWMQSVFYLPFWQWEFLFGQLMWTVIYILRALSEERHLSQFQEYREYRTQVRYRFIPGII